MNRLILSLCPLILAAGAAMADPALTAQGAGGALLTDAGGMTLYTFDKDAAPGDVAGDGVKGVWHIARP